MNKIFFSCLGFLMLTTALFTGCQSKSGDDKYIHLFKEMFSNMVVKKDVSLIPEYYHQDVIIYTNGHEIDYDSFLKSHETYYQSPIEYQIEYDEETFVKEGNKVAGRVWITTSRPQEAPRKIEVILIVEYKEDKIFRVWELTYPDWSKLPAFEDKKA